MNLLKCKGFPNEFVEYINYTRNMEFEADPDYKFLRGLLVSVLEKQNTTYDFWYDWVTEAPNITDPIAIERYIKNNPDVSLETPDDKKDKEKLTTDNDNEKENNLNPNKYTNLNTMSDTSTPAHNSEIQKVSNPNNSSMDNNNISNTSVGKNDDSLDKKDSKKSKEKKKKDKNKNGDKDKKGCLIW